MHHLKKLGLVLGVKGGFCLLSLTMIALALVTYTASIIITPTQQFTIGASSASWMVYVNDVDKGRYLPGGPSQPTFIAGDPNTYAFKVVTDANQVCAVKIGLISAMDSSKFSNFNVTVEYWTGATWTGETMYTASTGSTTKSYIDGLVLGDVGYIHQDASTTRYYLVKVTYSYDKMEETTQVTAIFQYTPLPETSF